MNKKIRLLIFFIGVGVICVLLLIFSFSMGKPGSVAGGHCSKFGVPLTWQTISLEKFNNFWAIKNGIDQKYCESNGGTWGVWSKAWQSCYCVMSTPDANKECSNSSDCLSGQCLYDAKTTSGKCAEFKMQYPTPNCELDTVRNGKLVRATCSK